MAGEAAGDNIPADQRMRKAGNNNTSKRSSGGPCLLLVGILLLSVAHSCRATASNGLQPALSSLSSPVASSTSQAPLFASASSSSTSSSAVSSSSSSTSSASFCLHLQQQQQQQQPQRQQHSPTLAACCPQSNHVRVGKSHPSTGPFPQPHSPPQDLRFSTNRQPIPQFHRITTTTKQRQPQGQRQQKPFSVTSQSDMNMRQQDRSYNQGSPKPLVILEPIVLQHTLYYPGNIPLVITAGHGGSHQPGHTVQLKTTHRLVRIPDLPTTTDPITVGSFTRPVAPTEGDETVPWMSLRDQSQGGNFKKDLNTHAMALNLASAISCLTRDVGYGNDYERRQGRVPEECESQGRWGDDDSDFPFPTWPSTPSPSPSPSPSPTLGPHTLADIDQQQEKLKFDAHNGVSYPHVIVFRVSRRYVDVNRNLTGENAIAEGDPVAEAAWREYHDLIDHVQAMIVQQRQKQQQELRHGDEERGSGLLLDIHGHAHSTNLIEIGYLLDGFTLGKSDEQLNAQARNLSEISGIRSLISRTVNTFHTATDRTPYDNEPQRRAEAEKISLSALIRGRTESLGGMLQSEGLNAVPSPKNPAPCQECIYFFGGHTVQIHGSQQRTTDSDSSQRPAMDAIQLELPKILRLVENPEAREIGMKLGSAVVQFMTRYYGVFTTSGKINEPVSDRRFEQRAAKVWGSRKAVDALPLTAQMLHQHRPPPHQPQQESDGRSHGAEPWESSQSGDSEDEVTERDAHLRDDPSQRRLDLKRQSSRL